MTYLLVIIIEESIQIPPTTLVQKYDVKLDEILNFDKIWEEYEKKTRIIDDDDDDDDDDEKKAALEKEEEKNKRTLHIFTYYSFYAYIFANHKSSSVTDIRESFGIKNKIYENYQKLL